MTRTGKIARLPYNLREELNERLLNNEPGVRLVKWLNDQRIVQNMVQFEFEGIPMSEQNLSEWKGGGYQNWLNNREARGLVLEVAGKAKDLNEAMEGENMVEVLTTVLLAEMMKLAKVLMQPEENTEKRWVQLKEVSREILKIRRLQVNERKVAVTENRQESKEDDRQRRLAKEEAEERRQKLLAPLQMPFQAHAMAPAYGGGKGGESVARRILEIKNDLPLGVLDGETKEGKWEFDGGDWEWVGKREDRRRKADGRRAGKISKAGRAQAEVAPSPRPAPPVGAREAGVRAADEAELSREQP